MFSLWESAEVVGVKPRVSSKTSGIPGPAITHGRQFSLPRKSACGIHVTMTQAARLWKSIGRARSATVALGLALLVGCGGSGSGSSTTSQRGPAGAAAFVGTTILVNPTLRFMAGGSVEYTNTEAGSPFPPSATPINGTYTYVPSSTFTTGTLTLQLPGPITIALTLSGFEVSGGNVTSFRATYNGTPFVATVTNGRLPSAPDPGTGDPGTGEQPAGPIPSGIQAAYDMTFTESTIGSGIVDGSERTFNVGESTLNFTGRTISNPVFRNGNTNEWIFKDGTIEYALSQTTATQINEINVTGPAGAPFYGRFRVTTPGDGGIVLLPNGNLPPGTTVTLGMTSSQVGGTEPPDDVPVFAVGEMVTFTVDSSGALVAASLSIPFQSSSDGNLVYLEMIGTPLNLNTATLTLDATTKAPVTATLSFSRDAKVITYNFSN